MSMIPESFVRDALKRQAEIWEPDGYTYRRVRDRRWLWLRWRTIKTPYWRPIRIKFAPTTYLPPIVDRDPGDEHQP